MPTFDAVGCGSEDLLQYSTSADQRSVSSEGDGNEAGLGVGAKRGRADDHLGLVPRISRLASNSSFQSVQLAPFGLSALLASSVCPYAPSKLLCRPSRPSAAPPLARRLCFVARCVVDGHPRLPPTDPSTRSVFCHGPLCIQRSCSNRRYRRRGQCLQSSARTSELGVSVDQDGADRT